MNIRVADLELKLNKKEQEILKMSQVVNDLTAESAALSNELKLLKKSAKESNQDGDDESDASEAESVAGVVQSLNLLKNSVKPSGNSVDDALVKLMHLGKGISEWIENSSSEEE